MSYSIQYKASALKEIKRLDPQIRKRVRNRIAGLAEDPRPAGAKKIVGSHNAWRLREGDWRIIYEIHDDALVVQVVKIGSRGQIYRDHS